MNILDTFYEDYAQGHYNKTETINRIVRHMYEHPSYYRLEMLTQDSLQDFMVFCHPHLYYIIETYDRNRSTFATFFQFCLSMERKKYFNIYYTRTAQTKAIASYLEEEPITEAADPSEAICYLKDHHMTLKEIENTYPFFKRIRSLSMEQKLLIIALKACHFMTPELTAALADLIHMDYQELSTLITRCDKTLDKRIRRWHRQEERLNGAYMAKKQLSFQIENTPPGFQRNTLERQLEMQTLLCQRYFLQYMAMPPMAPSNKNISQILKISSSSVSHFLNGLSDKTAEKSILKP